MRTPATEYRSGISGTTIQFSVVANECTHPSMSPPRQCTLPITFGSVWFRVRDILSGISHLEMMFGSESGRVRDVPLENMLSRFYDSHPSFLEGQSHLTKNKTIPLHLVSETNATFLLLLPAAILTTRWPRSNMSGSGVRSSVPVTTGCVDCSKAHSLSA